MTTGRDPAAEWNRVAAQLANMPDVIRQLEVSHQDDGTGHCTGCTTPGRGTRSVRYPCSLASLAAEAKRLRHMERKTPGLTNGG